MSEVVEMVEPASIEQVNKHLLEKLDDLILSVDPKTDPEMVKVLTESVAKLNSSLKGNEIFEKPESEAERLERRQREIFEGVLTE